MHMHHALGSCRVLPGAHDCLRVIYVQVDIGLSAYGELLPWLGTRDEGQAYHFRTDPSHPRLLCSGCILSAEAEGRTESSNGFAIA